MSVLVGVDAGGSHTEAVASDASLTPRGRYRGPRGAVTADTTGPQAEVIAAVTQRALDEAGFERADVVVVGAAGAGQGETRVAFAEALGAILGPGVRVHVTTDAAITLEAAFPNQAGIVLIAGSGSIAYGRDADGTIYRVGGLGWQLGDEGSGYALAREALAAVARAEDGRGRETALTARLTREIGAADLDAVVRWAQQARPFEVATLARAVCETAEGGDAVARELVGRAARDLCSLIDAMAARMPVVKQVALAGGLLHGSTMVRRELLALVRDEIPAIEVLDAEVDPALGALAMAVRVEG